MGINDSFQPQWVKFVTISMVDVGIEAPHHILQDGYLLTTSVI